MASEEKELHHLYRENEISGHAKDSVKGNLHANTPWTVIGNDSFSVELNWELHHMHRTLWDG